MKNLLQKVIFLSFMLSVLSKGHGQSEVDTYLQIGAQDGRKYIDSYTKPLFQGIGFGFTSGWYNTAEAHQPFGFDITILSSLAFVPSSDLTFKFNGDEYLKLKTSSGEKENLPTIFGPQRIDKRPEMAIQDENGEELVRISSAPGAVDLKKGLGVNAVPLPMLQFGIGVYKGTDVKLRFLPRLALPNETSVSMFGLGVQHDIGQWFRRLRAYDISFAVLGAFNGLYMSTDLSYDEEGTEDNRGKFKVNGFNLQVIASKEYVNIITIYGGWGYSRSGSRLQVLGYYPVDEQYEAIPDDPIDISNANSSMNLTAGIRIKLYVLTLGIAHTIQDYQVTTASLGISIR